MPRLFFRVPSSKNSCTIRMSDISRSTHRRGERIGLSALNDYVYVDERGCLGSEFNKGVINNETFDGPGFFSMFRCQFFY